MEVFTLNGLPAEYKGLDWDEILKRHSKVCLAERKKRLADPTCKGSKITGEILSLYEELNHKSLDFGKCYRKNTCSRCKCDSIQYGPYYKCGKGYLCAFCYRDKLKLQQLKSLYDNEMMERFFKLEQEQRINKIKEESERRELFNKRYEQLRKEIDLRLSLNKSDDNIIAELSFWYYDMGKETISRLIQEIKQEKTLSNEILEEKRKEYLAQQKKKKKEKRIQMIDEIKQKFSKGFVVLILSILIIVYYALWAGAIIANIKSCSEDPSYIEDEIIESPIHPDI